MDIDKKAFDKLEKSVNDLTQHNFLECMKIYLNLPYLIWCVELLTDLDG